MIEVQKLQDEAVRLKEDFGKKLRVLKNRAMNYGTIPNDGGTEEGDDEEELNI